MDTGNVCESDVHALRGRGRGLEDLEQQSTSMKGQGGDREASRDLLSVDVPDGDWRWRGDVCVTRAAQEPFAFSGK
ncbi:MAG: hypothetical protein OXC29_06390 [Rhodococcus sp.]|nr:hypothetical protein [Rhodococcus sp. (in: high G+C Gram-positive bacteria)]